MKNGRYLALVLNAVVLSPAASAGVIAQASVQLFPCPAQSVTNAVFGATSASASAISGCPFGSTGFPSHGDSNVMASFNENAITGVLRADSFISSFASFRVETNGRATFSEPLVVLGGSGGGLISYEFQLSTGAIVVGDESRYSSGLVVLQNGTTIGSDGCIIDHFGTNPPCPRTLVTSKVPFVFGVPFDLTATLFDFAGPVDPRMIFEGLEVTGSASATLSKIDIFNQDMTPNPNAFVQVVPEPTTLTMLVGVTGFYGVLCAIRRRFWVRT